MWRVFGERSFKEIGDLYGKSGNWACITYHRARKMIQRRLEENEHENECSIVRDILPLYLENMVSDETGAFVKEHLKVCPECTAELEALKAGPKIEKVSSEMQDSLEAEVMKCMKAARKKFRKKAYGVAAVIAGIFIIVCVLLHFFPVYRMIDIGPMTMGNYFSGEQIA